MLDCHPQTVYKNPGLPSLAIPGIGVRFKPNDINKYLENAEFKRDLKLEQLIENKENILQIPPVFDRIKTGGLSGMARAKSKSRYNLGFGAIYQRKTKGKNVRWYVDFRDSKGKRIQMVVPHALTREEALIALRAEVSKVFSGEYKVRSRKEDMTFEEFSQVYLKDYMAVERKNWKSDSYRLGILEQFFLDTKLREIGPERIRKLKKSRLDEGNSERTVNRYLALLKRMFTVAIADGYATDNPVKQVKLFSEKDSIRERIRATRRKRGFFPSVPMA